MSKKVLVIGSGWEQADLLEKAVEMGVELVASHTVPLAEAAHFAGSNYVKDSRDVLGHCRIAETHGIDGVLTDNCDFSLYTAALVASRFDLEGQPCVESARVSNDKFQQRTLVSETRVSQPVFQRVYNPGDAASAAASIGFPCIFKPVDSRGTFGVTRVDSPEEVLTAYIDAVHNSHSRTVLCERFIEGVLVTSDGFCFSDGHRALTVASRQFDEGPKPVTKEIIYPGIFDTPQTEQILTAHEDVVGALGFRSGHTHGEYILTPEGEIYLVECTNRGGGVFTSSCIVPYLTGIDLNAILINQALGCDTSKRPSFGAHLMRKGVVLAFLDFKAGKVIRRMNAATMHKVPGVLKFRTLYREKDMVEAISDCAGRHIMTVVVGDDRAEAVQNFVNLKEAFDVEYFEVSS